MKEVRVEQSITVLESRSGKLYLQELKKIPVLSHEEEFDLISKIQEGNKKAEENLILFNLRFVITVAKKYSAQTNLPLEDLISEGNIGLIKAAQRFDKSRGFKFISYAVWWIRQSIIQALAEQSRIVKVPMNKVGIRNKVAQATQHLEQEFEREPTAEELSEFLDIDLDDVSATMSLSNRHVSIDSPLDEDGDGSMLDIMENKNAEPTDQESNKESMLYEIELALSSLPEKQQKVLRYLYGIEEIHQWEWRILVQNST